MLDIPAHSSHFYNNMYHKFAALFLITILALSNNSLNVEANDVSTTLKNSSSSLNALAEKMTESPESLSGYGLIIKNKEGLSNASTKVKLARNIAKFQSVSEYKAGNKLTTMYSYQSLKDLQEGLKTALLDSTVEIVQPNFKYRFLYNPTSNPKFNNTDQWYLQNGVGTMNAASGWDAMQTRLGLSGCSDTGTNKQCGGLSSVKVAIIDSGVNTNIAEVPEFTNSNIDTANSVRFYTRNDNNCDSIGDFDTTLQDSLGNWIVFCKRIGSQFDEVGHGTIVAQQIVAGNNTFGGIGIGYNLTLLPIALHGGSLNTYYISKAIDYATDQQVSAINLSLGSSSDSFGLVSSSLNRAIQRGVIPVAASGNCGDVSERDCFGDPGLSPNLNPLIYPAALNNTIAVGASNFGTVASNITKASYSSFGNFLDFVAPVGGGASTTTPNGIYGQCGKTYNTSNPFDPNFSDPCNNKFLTNNPGCLNSSCGDSKWYGTSFAAPQITALVGLIKSIDPAADINNILQLLRENSTDIGVTGYDNNTGWGIPKIDQVISNMWSGYSIAQWGTLTPVEYTVFSVNNRVYQTIMGTETRLYFRSSSDATNWGSWTEGGGITLKDFPKIIEFNGRLYQSGFSTDNKMYTRSSPDGTTWSRWDEGGGITLKDRPEMIVFNSQLIQTGASTDNKLYSRSSPDGTTWSRWQEGGGITIKNTPSLVVFGGKLFQTARGMENRMYTRSTSDFINWTSWQGGNGIDLSDRPVSTISNGRFFQSGFSPDRRIYTRTSTDGTNWSIWGEGNRAEAIGRANLVSFGNKLFQTIVGTDNKIYTRSTLDGVNWSSWSEASKNRTSIQPSTFVYGSKLYQSIVKSDSTIWLRNKINSN
jgi:hypothetical protein